MRRTSNAAYRKSLAEWNEKLMNAYESMSEAEKRALHEWEKAHVDGSGKFGTSDWPGWEKYVGAKPTPPR